MLPRVERGWSTFKQALRKRPYGRIVERADAVGYRPAMLAIPLQRDDQLSVTEHRHVRVVRARDDLTVALKLAKPLHDAVVYEPVIEIILGLVDDERCRRSAEEQEEQGSSSLTLR